MIERIKEQFKKIVEKISQVNTNTSNKKKIIIGISAVLLISLAIVITMALNNDQYEILYTDIDTAEAAEIMMLLEAEGTPYTSEDGAIFVPKESADALRVSLATQGYPKSGFTYDIFINHVGLLATDFEKYTYARFELETRLGATITMFEGVEEARVAIAMAEEQKYVLEEDEVETTASVVVVMKDGGSPTDDQVRGIQRLVATSVPGLEMDNVGITNGNGEEVTGYSSDPSSGASELKLSVENKIESSVRAKVLHLLEPVFGEDYIRVTVKSSVDIDKKLKEIIEYIPSQDNTGVLSEETTSYEVQGQGEVIAGVPGAETNADDNLPVYPGITTDGTDVYFRDDQAKDYLVSQITEQIQSDAGELTDLTVSVTLDSATLTEEKAGEFRLLIATAAGIPIEDADSKIAIVNAEFYEEPPVELVGLNAILANYPWLTYLVPAIIALLLALIITIIIVNRRIKAKKAAEALEEQRRLEEEKYEAVIALDERAMTREEELRIQIQEFADANPAIAAQLLKTWLHGGEEK